MVLKIIIVFNFFCYCFLSIFTIFICYVDNVVIVVIIVFLFIIDENLFLVVHFLFADFLFKQIVQKVSHELVVVYYYFYVSLLFIIFYFIYFCLVENYTNVIKLFSLYLTFIPIFRRVSFLNFKSISQIFTILIFYPIKIVMDIFILVAKRKFVVWMGIYYYVKAKTVIDNDDYDEDT